MNKPDLIKLLETVDPKNLPSVTEDLMRRAAKALRETNHRKECAS